MVKHHSIEHQTDSNIIFRIFGFERVNLVVITFEHSIFGFEGTDINNPSSQDLLNYSANRIKHFCLNIKYGSSPPYFFLCDRNTTENGVNPTLSILLLRSFRFQSTNLSKLELPLVIGYAALTLQPNAKHY